MRLQFAGVALTLVASLTLVACIEESPSAPPADEPRQLEVDLDFTKTKTVTAPPLLTPQPPHRRPATTTRASTAKRVTP